jgi:hypothetical protein
MAQRKGLQPGSDADKILQLLMSAPATNNRMIWHLGVPKYTNRISELRKYGYIITAEKIQDGLWLYRYEGKQA